MLEQGQQQDVLLNRSKECSPSVHAHMINLAEQACLIIRPDSQEPVRKVCLPPALLPHHATAGGLNPARGSLRVTSSDWRYSWKFLLFHHHEMLDIPGISAQIPQDSIVQRRWMLIPRDQTQKGCQSYNSLELCWWACPFWTLFLILYIKINEYIIQQWATFPIPQKSPGRMFRKN